VSIADTPLIRRRGPRLSARPTSRATCTNFFKGGVHDRGHPFVAMPSKRVAFQIRPFRQGVVDAPPRGLCAAPRGIGGHSPRSPPSPLRGIGKGVTSAS